jgi:hypothetical protein
MKQRGRRSVAALSIVAGTSIDNRPSAPDTLSEAEADVWNRVVNSEASDTFKTAALQAMLVGFCRHTVEADNLSAALNGMLGEVDGLMVKLRLELLKARESETKAAAGIATKLRLTNQSRYQPSTAAVKVNNASTERKLWDRRA